MTCSLFHSTHIYSQIALKRCWSIFWVLLLSKKKYLDVKIRRRKWQPTPVLLPGESHGWGSLVGWSPWGRSELDTTEWLHFHFSLSCIGEGNGNPLQCSCLENPRDGGAWWASIYGVTQSRTRLKQLSSSSSNVPLHGLLHFAYPFMNWRAFGLLPIFVNYE